ncbi:hypothetical protein A2U01_0114594, partial [Trifolium medium]|nr:hypothetical protein [Trifolium medium]
MQGVAVRLKSQRSRGDSNAREASKGLVRRRFKARK